MTTLHPNARILRLNAALDGELDAANSLELEREMRRRPGACRRISAASPRCATRCGRHAPREAAPAALADADRSADCGGS